MALETRENDVTVEVGRTVDKEGGYRILHMMQTWDIHTRLDEIDNQIASWQATKVEAEANIAKLQADKNSGK